MNIKVNHGTMLIPHKGFIMDFVMSRKNEWIKECVDNYILHGISQKDAFKKAHQDAIKEEMTHGSIVDIWEPADALVISNMKEHDEIST